MKEASILIVEDEEELRENMYDLLELEGYQVAACDTGDAAVTFIDKKLPDMVLLDIQLPGIDGIEVLRILKEKIPFLPIIIISASSQKGTKEKLDEYGADGFVLKPYDQDNLLNLMNSLLQKA